MYSTTDYRNEGRKLKAKDLAERLLPDLHMNEFVAWSPDLFAFTSYILSQTSAYQLVVSPPTGEQWPPANNILLEWLGIEWKDSKWRSIPSRGLKEHFSTWLQSFLIRDGSKKLDRKWILDTTDFQGLILNVDPDKRERFYDNSASIDEKIGILAEHLKEEALASLLKEYKGKNAQEILLEYKVAATSKFEKKLEREGSDGKRATAIKDAIEKVSEKTTIYLGDFLKDEIESGWVPFVQHLGDEWNTALAELTGSEFQLINHSLDDEEGNIFRERSYDNTALTPEKYVEQYIGTQETTKEARNILEKNREKKLFATIVRRTPPLVLACWAYLYNEVNSKGFYGQSSARILNVSDLLCNRDEIQLNVEHRTRLWKLAQCIFTMHAIADICCTTWGIYPVSETGKVDRAKLFAQDMLYDKGSLSTINPERGRVIPKRHNPGVGITLRSISSNLAFHQSSIEIVWRKTQNTDLERLINVEETTEDDRSSSFKTLSILLLPFPLEIKAKDFGEDEFAKDRVKMSPEYGFFQYDPQKGLEPNQKESEDEELVKRLYKLIVAAKQELEPDRFVDIIVLPESALSKSQMRALEIKLISESDDYEQYVEDIQKLQERTKGKKIDHPDFARLARKQIEKLRRTKAPSIIISGIRESRSDILADIVKTKKLQIEKETNATQREELSRSLKSFQQRITSDAINFDRNAVYCKYFDQENYTPVPDRHTCKFKQHKHHRWQLTPSQIKSYGLSQVLETETRKIWWEAMKVPKRRVSFLNVANAITISHLVCEDLARQDPIADLIRHVGPSLVVSLLMDGPQLKERWPARYASILSDDPGSSVITLTSFGMVKRFNSPFGPLSRVIAMWSESQGAQKREIELANGAEAVLLSVKLTPHAERTADGRKERTPTNTLGLMDVIQIYPPKAS